MKKTIIGTLALAAALLGAAATWAGTWRVEQDGSGDFATLQRAVDAAASGDTILIGPGDYQEMESVVNHAGYTIEVFAYWDDAKDLVFLGAGKDVVRFGPSEYLPNNTSGSPCGIASEAPNRIEIAGVSFGNLYWSVVNVGETNVNRCSFIVGRDGIYVKNSNARTFDCSFESFERSVAYNNCDTVEVIGCLLNDANVYFGNTEYGHTCPK